MNNNRPFHLLIGGLLIILTAQILNHYQVEASTEKALTQAQISHYLVPARDLKLSLERGLAFGKPLALFSGTDKLFSDLKNRYQGIQFLAITGPLLEPYASDKAQVAALDSIAQNQRPIFKGDEYKYFDHGDLILVALPVYFNNTEWKGTSWLGFSKASINEKMAEESTAGWWTLAVSGGASVTLFLLLFFLFIKPQSGTGTSQPVAAVETAPQAKPARYLSLLTRVSLFIGAVLLVSLLGYTLSTNARITPSLVQEYKSNVALLAQSQSEEFKKILDLDVEPPHWKNADSFLGSQIHSIPEVENLSVTDATGKTLYAAGEGTPEVQDLSKEGGIKIPLTSSVSGLQGYLTGQVSQKFLDAILLDRLLDALTVTLVSLVFSIELLLVMGLFLQRRKVNAVPESNDDAETNLKIIRFTAFLFFMAELLPLPFMPLFIADLYSHSPLVIYQLSSDAIKGLPFSAHLLGVMIFLPVVGYLTQKVSLKSLFLICGALLLAGNLLASISNSLEVLMLFRLLSGMGYGGVLAASAGLVVQTTDKKHRTTGFASWGAGFAAASICAVALGGILVSHVGYRNGLIVSAVLSLVLATFILFYLPKKAPEKNQHDGLPKLSDFLAPFRNRSTFAALVFASIPAQLAFFGLFQYTLPLAMNQIGITDANIGRILTIYGLISLAAPLLARFSDRTRNERLLIIGGNMLTGVVLAAFFLQTGVWQMIIGVAAIGLGGLMFDTVISSYLSMTKISEELGETKFLSIFSTWEKLFTVFIPVIVGTMMTQFGYLPAAGIMGIFITVGALLFALFSRNLHKDKP